MTVFYVGPTIGTAMVIKVVSNMLCCVNVVAMGEALMLGEWVGGEEEEEEDTDTDTGFHSTCVW